MLLSNPAKSLLACILLLFPTAGCGLLPSASNSQAPLVPEIKSSLPFATREPENFQCDMVVTADGSTRRTMLARMGERRRTDFEAGEKQHRAVLSTDKEYLIAFDEKIYAERPPKAGAASSEQQFTDLTLDLLNRGERAEFEEIGRENSVIMYRVILGDAYSNEIIVHFDEAIGLPVKQEFFALNGDEKTLQYSVELLNFRTDVDEGLFVIPAGFRRVSLSGFYNLQRK